VEARLRARLHWAVRAITAKYSDRNDVDRAARECAAELRAVLEEVVYRGRLEARRFSHKALEDEIELARSLGAGPIPAPTPTKGSDVDRIRARAAAQAYANAWLHRVLEAHAAALRQG